MVNYEGMNTHPTNVVMKSTIATHRPTNNFAIGRLSDASIMTHPSVVLSESKLETTKKTKEKQQALKGQIQASAVSSLYKRCHGDSPSLSENELIKWTLLQFNPRSNFDDYRGHNPKGRKGWEEI